MYKSFWGQIIYMACILTCILTDLHFVSRKDEKLILKASEVWLVIIHTCKIVR